MRGEREEIQWEGKVLIPPYRPWWGAGRGQTARLPACVRRGVVERLTLDDMPDGSAEVIALDVVDAGVGDKVLVVQEGSSARKIFNDEKIPVQAVIVGVLDRVDVQP